MAKRLLVSYAHPDDESFGLGSVIGKYTAEGAEVSLICATNGDVGTVAPERLQGYNSVAELRLAELDCAAQVLGFKEVITFGYRDSGMMHSADNDHPESLWQAPLDVLTDKVADVMRRLQPQVIITFDPFGGYGHPDHIKIHKATLAAYETLKAEPLHPQKLYYAAFPRALIRLGVGLVRLRGQDPRRMGTNKDLDLQAVLDATLPTHTRIDVSGYYEIGMRAAACHASQISPRPSIPGARRIERMISSNASFTRVDPPPRPGEPLERDLFAGVTAQ